MTRILTGKRLLLATAAIGAAGLAAMIGGLYGTGAGPGNRRAAAACAASTPALDRLRPAAKGEVAAFQATKAASPAPALAFRDGDGRLMTLADFAGRTILLNLWATWCEPCKREMPALDTLQAELGGPDFAVVAVNIDTRNLDRPLLWLRSAGIKALHPYADPEAATFQVLRRAGITEGLPVTLLIAPDGCGLGHLAGWAEWASPDGVALVRAALGR